MKQRFVNGDQEYRDSTFKIIPQVIEGPWIVQKSVGSGSSSVPVLLGKRLKMDYFVKPEYIEVDINVDSSSVAASITKLVRSMTKYVVIDIAILLEGKNQSELPERLIGLFRMNHMNMNAAEKLSIPKGRDEHLENEICETAEAISDDSKLPTENFGDTREMNASINSFRGTTTTAYTLGDSFTCHKRTEAVFDETINSDVHSIRPGTFDEIFYDCL